MPARWAGTPAGTGIVASRPREVKEAGAAWGAPDFFGALPLTEPARRAVWEAGYRQPTPVQALCIPPLLAGKDCVGQAHTGTGKTAAFGLPIVERVDPQAREVQAVILVPTRELCRQVTGELERLSRYRGISVLAVYGGEGMERQLRALGAGGVQVVVGTPGRVIDHIWRGTLRLDGVRICILDEADEMLDIGFAEDIDRILRCMPVERQTALFSATIPPFVHRLVQRYLKEPEWISTVGAASTPTARIPTQIRQEYVQVAERDKLAAVEELIHTEPGYDRVLVFRRMKITADRLAQQMQRKGLSARALHGDLPQAERNRVLEDFRAGRIRFLVATNVAARGLDIRDVSHVLNFDLPETADEYTHRIGRTGRAGKAGTAISFVAEWDFEPFEAIKSHVGGALHERELKLYS
jgi:ATP-dependent RNA helicase DeaD